MLRALLRPTTVLIFAATPALSAAGAHWRCQPTPDMTALACHAGTPAVRVAAQAPAAVTAHVNGTRFPLDPARRWMVDLWTVPTDIEQVELLVRATICYRSPGCTVQLDWPMLAPPAR